MDKRGRKEMNNWKKKCRQECIEKKDKIEIITMIIGAICTVISICFGFAQINSTLKEQRFFNRLELADNLMNEYISLSEEASRSVFYLVVNANEQAEEYDNYSNSVEKHSKKLEKMKNKIMAYGSAELVNLFFDSYNDIQLKIQNGEGDFESFKNYCFSIPLIAVYIKYDLTGEKVNSSIFYNSCMQELKALEVAGGMEKFHEEMILANNELVKKYNLPSAFIWEETIK